MVRRRSVGCAVRRAIPAVSSRSIRAVLAPVVMPTRTARSVCPSPPVVASWLTAWASVRPRPKWAATASRYRSAAITTKRIAERVSRRAGSATDTDIGPTPRPTLLVNYLTIVQPYRKIASNAVERCGGKSDVVDSRAVRGGAADCRQRGHGPRGRRGFFVGLALFVGLCGYLDTRLPWPRRGRD